MAYKGGTNFTGQGAIGANGGGYTKTPMKHGAKGSQTTTFVEPVWDEGPGIRNTVSLKTTTVSDGDSVIRKINTPC